MRNTPCCSEHGLAVLDFRVGRDSERPWAHFLRESIRIWASLLPGSLPLGHFLQEGHVVLALAYIATSEPPCMFSSCLPRWWLVLFRPLLCALGPLFANEIYYSVDLRQQKAESCQPVWKCSLKQKKDSKWWFPFPTLPSSTSEMEDAFRNHRTFSSDVQPLMWGASSGTWKFVF